MIYFTWAWWLRYDDDNDVGDVADFYDGYVCMCYFFCWKEKEEEEEVNIAVDGAESNIVNEKDVRRARDGRQSGKRREKWLGTFECRHALAEIHE